MRGGVERSSSKPSAVSGGAYPWNDQVQLEWAADSGIAIHALIAAAAAQFGPKAHVGQLQKLAGALISERLAPVYRQSLKQRVVTAATRYFTRFGPVGWTFVGSEVVVGEVALDLVWTRGGLVMADELKTGAVSLFGEDELKLQIEAQLAAARSRWGEAFHGVRSIRLLEPELSRLEQ